MQRYLNRMSNVSGMAVPAESVTAFKKFREPYAIAYDVKAGDKQAHLTTAEISQ